MNSQIELKFCVKDEIEITNLLTEFSRRDLSFEMVKKETHKNHYFINVDIGALIANISGFLNTVETDELKELMVLSNEMSVRTRELNSERVFLIIKTILINQDQNFGNLRDEFEKEINITLDELDRLIINSKGIYQAKWSRTRVCYRFLDYTINIDKNAGYGYIVEIKKANTKLENQSETIIEINDLIAQLGFTPLSKEKLDKMNSFYNDHWIEYYDTDKTFDVELVLK
jgi:adenylate cyclase class IV